MDLRSSERTINIVTVVDSLPNAIDEAKVTGQIMTVQDALHKIGAGDMTPKDLATEIKKLPDKDDQHSLCFCVLGEML